MMNKSLKEYIRILQEKNLLLKIHCPEEEREVRQITYDSKAAGEGCLFVCKGAAFKKQYLEDALKKGAFVYVSEKDYEIPGASFLIVRDVREAMPYIAQQFYDIPEDFHCIGITGTKGKTTTAYYLKAVFDEAMEKIGKPGAAFMTTVETYDGKEKISSGITTPEAFEIYRHFRNAYDSGIRYMIMEVSSQALKYKRVQGISFDTAVFLNISEDHISPIEHADFDDYFQSKLKIFEQCKTAIICTDSPYAKEIRQAAEKSKNIVSFGFEEKADFRGLDVKPMDGKTAFCLKTKEQKEECLLNMRGKFNVENALAVFAVAKEFALPMEDVKKALERVSVPGRGEEYESADGRLHVIVDYAHNGFSVQSVLKMARENWPNRRIVSVFGCTGGKAINRRKDMGLAAGEWSDYIYLTADDPAKEKVEDICEEIAGYIQSKNGKYEVVPDRKKAIQKAIQDAVEPSVILILGKGCETTQKTEKGNEPYESDAVIAKETLKKV